MRIQQFLDHHGIVANPFADEDAQTDLVFKGVCIRNTFHPTMDEFGHAEGAFGSVDFDRLYPRDKARYKADILRDFRILRDDINNWLTELFPDCPDSLQGRSR